MTKIWFKKPDGPNVVSNLVLYLQFKLKPLQKYLKSMEMLKT